MKLLKFRPVVGPEFPKFKDWNYTSLIQSNDEVQMCRPFLQVDLAFPRTQEQMSLLASAVLPSISSNLEELRITGFLGVPIVELEGNIQPILNRKLYAAASETEPRTLSTEVLSQIKASCPALKTFIIRNCMLDLEPDSHVYLPKTLEKLEFQDCRWSNNPCNWFLMSNTVFRIFRYPNVFNLFEFKVTRFDLVMDGANDSWDTRARESDHPEI
jgi:hypothetical protein